MQGNHVSAKSHILAGGKVLREKYFDENIGVFYHKDIGSSDHIDSYAPVGILSHVFAELDEKIRLVSKLLVPFCYIITNMLDSLTAEKISKPMKATVLKSYRYLCQQASHQYKKQEEHSHSAAPYILEAKPVVWRVTSRIFHLSQRTLSFL